MLPRQRDAGPFLNSPSAADKGATRLKSGATKKPAPKKTEEKKPETPKDDDKPFDEVVKDMEVIKGLFTFYRKADDGRVLIEIGPDQFETNFLFAATIERSAGERGLYAAQMSASFPFYFHKVGKHIQWLVRNPSFTAAGRNTGGPGRSHAPSPTACWPRRASSPSLTPTERACWWTRRTWCMSDLLGLANVLKETYRPSDYCVRQEQQQHHRRQGLPGEHADRTLAALHHRQSQDRLRHAPRRRAAFPSWSRTNSPR